MIMRTNHHRRRRLALSALASFALIAAACGGEDAANTAAPATTAAPETTEGSTDSSEDSTPPAGSEMTVLAQPTAVSVQTDWFPSTDHAALYAAEALGFFEKRNLDVEIRPGGPGIRAANDVVTGNVTFGMAIPENVVLASAEGAELVTFFATYQQSPIGLMVHAESGITDLTGLREVQVFPGQVFWEVLKAENDLAADEIAYDGSLAAWLENKGWAVQAFATTNPNVARVNGADPVMLTATSLGFRSYAATIFTTDSYASQNPEVVRAFAEALQEGLEAFLADPAVVIAYINSVSPDFAIAIGEAAFPVMSELVVSETTERLGLGSMDGAVWDDVAARMFAAGIISTEVAGSDLWTNEYLVTG